MAKELPYFKFEPSEWLEGEIQVCSNEAIVCFINLCSGYWLKLGNINYAFALQKYCNRNAKVLQELVDNKIITLIDDKICISFLEKQLNEFKNVSEKRTEAANKRWGNKGKDAIALQLESKSNAIREDKIRIDKRRKENIINNAVFVSECKKASQWIEVTAMQNKIKEDVVFLFLDTFESHLITMEEQKKTLKEYKEHFTHWFKKQDLSNFRTKAFGKTNQI